MKNHQKVYLAAIIDGEGHVACNKKQYRKYVVINTTNRELALFLRRIVGGRLTRRKGKNGYKDSYFWRMGKREFSPMLKDVLPFILIKKKNFFDWFNPDELTTHSLNSVKSFWDNAEPSSFREEIAAYLTGIIDGEGSIMIRTLRKKTQRRFQFLPDIVVGNTDKRMIDWLQKYFGGRISIRKSDNPKWKDRYYWSSNSRQVKKITEMMKPYTIVKKAHIKQILKFYKLPRYTHKSRCYLTDRGFKKAFKIVRTISILNHKKSLLLKEKV